MISFPVSLSPRCLSFLARGQKWAGREEGMAQKLLSSPSPCSSGVSCWDTTQPFPRLAGERKGCGCILVSFRDPMFFFLFPPWPPFVSLTCTKKKIPPGISDFWFCFYLGLHTLLFTVVSLYLCLLQLPTSFTVTLHVVQMSASYHLLCNSSFGRIFAQSSTLRNNSQIIRGLYVYVALFNNLCPCYK